MWILQLGILETYIFGPKQLEKIWQNSFDIYIFNLHIYPQVGYIQSDVMSHIFLTFLGLGKKTYLQDSKHWSIKNITCPLISGSSFLYSFSSKFAKVFFSSREGGYVVFGVWSIFAFLRLSTTETTEVLPKTKSSMTGAQTLKYQRIRSTQRSTQRYVIDSNVSTACIAQDCSSSNFTCTSRTLHEWL